MALQVWLPLNGDLKNYGTSGLQPVQTTAPTYVNGKIGKAMSTGAFYLPAAEVSKFYNGNTMSFAFWIYPTGSGSVTSQIIGQSSTSANGCRMFTIYQYPNMVDLHLSWQSETGGNGFIQAVYSNAFTANAWNHCVITYDNPTCKVYINGALKQTYTAANTRTNFTYDVPIPNSSARYLNDLRIYDECLSPKQIKELSKALVVHYPLNDQYNSSVLNKYSGTYADGKSSWSSNWAVTKLSNEKGYNYKGTKTGDGNNSWWNLGCPVFSFAAGKRYFYSLKCRCNKFTNASLALRAARSSNDWVTNAVTICSTSLADGQWHEYYVSQTINETYDRSGTTVTSAPLLEAYTSNLNGNGTVYDMDFDLKDIQVVESDTYIPFIKNEFASATVFDTSGFMNNGTATGLTCTSDSPRYSVSTVFDGTSSSIEIQSSVFPIVLNGPFTVSMWIYDQETGGRSIFFGNYGLTGSFFNIEKEGSNKVRFYWNANPDFHCTNSPIAANAWTHLVMTRDGNTVKCYINGVLTDTSTTTLSGTIPTNATIFRLARDSRSDATMFKGRISDFRLYVTALSDADIKELYQTSASFDNLGNIHAYEISENL